MKQRGEELLVINKKIFFLILIGIAFVGVIIGYTIGYITTPVKEIYVNRIEDSEKTVLSTTVGTAFANKQEASATSVKQEQPQKSDGKDINQSKTEAQKQEVMQKEPDIKKQLQTSEQKEKTEVINRPLKSVKYKTYKLAVYTIQVGAFSDIANANFFQTKLKEAGYDSFLVKEDLYKVRVGKYVRFIQAKKVSQELNSRGFENFIIRIKGGKP